MARQQFGGASFGKPPERYDSQDEAQFRAAVERVVAEIAARALDPIPIYADATRPTAGAQDPLIIFNTTDGNLNIDNGTNWILPDGTLT